MFAKAVYAAQWTFKPETGKFKRIAQYTQVVRACPEVIALGYLTAGRKIIDATQYVLTLSGEHVSPGKMEKLRRYCCRNGIQFLMGRW